VGTPQFDPYAQALLTTEQVGSLAAFVSETAPSDLSPPLSFIDDDASELDVAWDERRRRLVIVAAPARNRGGGTMTADDLEEYPNHPTRIRLKPDQVDDLARFLARRPPTEG
jgi:hypothetical protein